MITITDIYVSYEGIKYKHGLLLKDLRWVGLLKDLFPVRCALSWWGGQSLAGRTSPSVKRTTQILCLPIRHYLVLPQGYLPEADPGISSFGQLSHLLLNAIQGSQNNHLWSFHSLPGSAWAGGNLAESGQIGGMSKILVNPTQIFNHHSA